MDCSPTGSPIHEILQVRVLEWVAISLSMNSMKRQKDRTLKDELPRLVGAQYATAAAAAAKSLQLCPTHCDPVDYSPPDSSIHGIFQARILEWVAMPSGRGCSQPRDQTWVSCIEGRLFTV